jgi:hypothetical protein
MSKERLVYGSTAIKHWCPDFPRTPKDVDYISKDGVSSKEVEYHWIPEFQYFLDNNEDAVYLDLNFIYTLKLAHLGWNIFWEKHVSDVCFLKSKGCVVDEKLYKKLVKGFTNLHGVKWASLKGKDSETFFEDAVKRKYVHDDIHEAVAIYDKPLYESLVYEGVSCSKKGFDKLSYDDKLNLVKEEVWVTALERWLIPRDFKFSKIEAYQKSLKKLATTMSSGWFKFFILTNIDVLRSDRDFSYIDKFKQAETENKLRTT